MAGEAARDSTVRCRILELVADGETSAGDVAEAVGEEVRYERQPAASQHLRVLRDNGFVTVRAQGMRRLYTVDPFGLREVGAWVTQFRESREHHLDALGAEIARGNKSRR